MNKVLKNTSWILIGNIVRIIISFIISILTTRYLGPNNLGSITYVQSYVTIFTAIINLGINGVIINEFIKDKKSEGKILGTSIVIRLFLGIISSIVFLPILNLIEKSDSTSIKIAILLAIQFPFLCLDTIQYWYQSKLKSKYPIIIQTSAYIIVSTFKIILIIMKASVEWFAFAISLDVILLGIFYIILYKRHQTQKLEFSKEIMKRMIKKCMPFVLSSLMVVIYGQMDKVMIKLLLSNKTAVGLYSIALTVANLIAFLPNAILESARPIILESKQKSEDLFHKRFCQSSALVFWICILYSLVITVFSKLILQILYGNQFLDASACLKIVVWYTAFSYIGSAKSIWLIANNKNKYVFIFSAMGALINLVLNYCMIPKYGINGAAFATLLTQILVNFILPIIFKETRKYSQYIFQAIILKNINIKEIINKIKILKLRR